MDLLNSVSPLPILIAKNGVGGVGKTEVIVNLIFLLLMMGYDPFYIDADDGQQDVYKTLKDELRGTILKLKREFGYKRLSEIVAEPDITGPIAVSAPGQDIELFLENLPVLAAAAQEAKRPLAVIWPLDLTIDAIIDLPKVVDILGIGRVWAVRNLFYGDPEEFEAFENSKIGKIMLKAGRVIDFPVTSSSVVAAYRVQRMSHRRMADEGGAQLRERLPHLRRNLERAFAPLLQDLGL